MANIENFFFETDGGRIFCTTVGDCYVSSKNCAIYFAPLFEERMWVQRIALNFARELWNRYQIPTLFFDYYGYGESDGEHEEFTLAHCHTDVKKLLSLLSEKYGVNHFIFWGIRTGCALALSFMQRCETDNISGIIFWAPVLDLAGFMHQSLLSTLASQYAMFKRPLAKRNEILEETLRNGACVREGFALNNIDGYRFGKPFLLELQQPSSKEAEDRIHCDTLILEVVPEGKSSRRKKINEAGGSILPSGGKIESFVVDEPEFWLIRQVYSQHADKLYHKTLEWIKTHVIETDKPKTIVA